MKISKQAGKTTLKKISYSLILLAIGFALLTITPFPIFLTFLFLLNPNFHSFGQLIYGLSLLTLFLAFGLIGFTLLTTRQTSTENIILLTEIVTEELEPGDKQIKEGDKAEKTATVIRAILNEHNFTYRFVTITIILTLIAYTGIAYFAQIELSNVVIFILCIAIVLINVWSLAFHYRISHGLYGTNEYEAREIIQFILNYTDDRDFTDGLGARPLDLSPETEKEIAAVWEGAKV